MPPTTPTDRVFVFAGSPAHNTWLFRRAPFPVEDPVMLVDLPREGGRRERWVILRDVELQRASRAGLADRVHTYEDFTPSGGLASDRETRAAQALAECLRRAGVREAWTDRATPAIYSHYLRQVGVELHCDPELGVMERRSKSAREVEALRTAQRGTEECVRHACELVARSRPDGAGVLQHQGAPLTADVVRAEINAWLLRNGFEPSLSTIVAPGSEGGDCHNRGAGLCRTGEPVIVDIFPRHVETRYYGDCTRTVVNGKPSPEIARMHAATVEAKRAAVAATRSGATGDAVHKAACAVMTRHGYPLGLPDASTPRDQARFVHGTGHGIGLALKEPPLLDTGGPALVAGDCVTIEPGLYAPAIGGVRVEDMYIVRDGGAENLNTLPETLTWT
jgi:Xaa-Pro aminopeptidase